MREVIAVKIDGETLYIEAEASPGSEVTSPSLDDVMASAEDAFERAKITVTTLTKDMVRAFRSIESVLAPQEFVLEFGIKFTAEGNAIVVSTTAEASLKITATYRNK
jgi:hypothetical protein